MFNLHVKVNPKQKSILFDAILRHKHILDDRTSALRTYKNDMWEKLAAQLNMHGPQKDVSQWKKCLKDLRFARRKRKLKRKKLSNLVIDRALKDYEKQIVRAYGILENTVSNMQSSSTADEVIDDLQIEIKEEQPDEIRFLNFEEVDVTMVGPATGQDLMRGTIKIEDLELPSKEHSRENESLFQSTESLVELQTSLCETDVTGGRNFQELYLMEILKESKKQTALLKELVDRLS